MPNAIIVLLQTLVEPEMLRSWFTIEAGEIISTTCSKDIRLVKSSFNKMIGSGFSRHYYRRSKSN